jgi:RimJ/RimL family protein N-acetyltransferase
LSMRTELPAPAADFGRLRLGPHRVLGHSVVLRPPVFADFDAWRQLRLRDREYIEPFWITSPLDWSARHTRKRWIRECMMRRNRAHAGTDLAMVVEVDGQFAGQVSLSALDFTAKTAELGIWVDVTLAKSGAATVAGALLLDFGFEVLGLERIVAPICTENVPASRSAERFGFVREAVMAEYFDAGGAFKDHALYSLLTCELPPEGLVRHWSAYFDATHRGGSANPIVGVEPPAKRIHVTVGVLRVIVTMASYWASVARTNFHRIRARAGKDVVLRARSGQVLLRRLAGHESCGCEPYALEVDGMVLGECGLAGIDEFQRSARLFFEVGPEVDPEFAEAGARRIIEYGFAARGMNRIWIAIASDDAFRADVAKRIGMAHEGTMRGYLPGPPRADRDLWAITAASAER